MARFPELDISQWEYRDQEPVGKNIKGWYRDPSDQSLWLFKPVGEGRDIAPDGKDWAEKLAHEIGNLFGIPTAPVELAFRGNQAGTISRNVNPTVVPIRSGASLLSARDPGFNMRDRDALGHSLTAISEVLTDVSAPVGYVATAHLDAFSVFCGYLVLDALIGNRDRHSQNWSVVVDSDLKARLMPSYDHGSSLGFSLSDAAREAALHDRTRFEAFVNRGTAYRFEGGRHTTLVSMAARALRMAGPEARDHWLGRVVSVTPDAIAGVVSNVPRMSLAARKFTIEFVGETQRRLGDAISN